MILDISDMKECEMEWVGREISVANMKNRTRGTTKIYDKYKDKHKHKI
jgi:hypothetical protein